MSLRSVALVAAMAVTGTMAQYCDLPTTPQWAATPDGPLALPMHNWTSLKDFTHVPYNGSHLVYGSIVNNSTYYSANFGLFKEWSQMNTTSQNLQTNPTVAPTLFYFAPASIWVICYQWGGHSFSYRTSNDPSDANSWGPEQALFDGSAAGAPYGPIDQTFIADDENAYLFFAGDDGQIYRTYMPLASFPGNFGTESQTILNDTVENLFEAVQVYKLKGQTKYLMIVECEGAVGRYFRSFTATSLAGNFTELSGLESNPFAGKSNTAITWSNDVSHGDLIRSTNDQTFEIDPCNLQFLIQARGQSTADYNDLPWRPDLLTLQNPVTVTASSSSATTLTTSKTKTSSTKTKTSSTSHSTTHTSTSTHTSTAKTSSCPAEKTKTVYVTVTAPHAGPSPPGGPPGPPGPPPY